MHRSRREGISGNVPEGKIMNDTFVEMAKDMEIFYRRLLEGVHLKPHEMALAVAYAALNPDAVSGLLFAEEVSLDGT